MEAARRVVEAVIVSVAQQAMTIFTKSVRRVPSMETGAEQNRGNAGRDEPASNSKVEAPLVCKPRAECCRGPVVGHCMLAETCREAVPGEFSASIRQAKQPSAKVTARWTRKR